MTTYRINGHNKAIDLLARLGERAAVYQDRDGLVIDGQFVPHSSAVRDYRCPCGSRLVTRFDDGRGWCTVCAACPGHPQTEFITAAAAQYREHVRQMEAMK